MAELRPEEVYIVDFRKFSKLLPIRFFRSMIPEVAIAVCGTCGHFFHQETWELEFLQNRCCPYCGSKEIDTAQTVAEAGSAVSGTATGGSLQPPTSLTSLLEPSGALGAPALRGVLGLRGGEGAERGRREDRRAG